jgi:hypothetical protein
VLNFSRGDGLVAFMSGRESRPDDDKQLERKLNETSQIKQPSSPWCGPGFILAACAVISCSAIAAAEWGHDEGA